MLNNLEKTNNEALQQLLVTVTSGKNCLSENSVDIIKTALQSFTKNIMITKKDKQCSYCETGNFIDNMGIIHRDYQFCPKCGYNLKE